VKPKKACAASTVPGVKPRTESLERIRAAGVSTANSCAAGRDGAVAVRRCEGSDTGEPHEPQKRCASGISHWQVGQRMCVLLFDSQTRYYGGQRG